MTIRYAVTFEFLTRPPLTHRGTVAALSAATCASRAIKESQRILQPRGWTSLVFCALERSDGPEDGGPPEGGIEASEPEGVGVGADS